MTLTEIVVVQESLCNVWPEHDADSSLVWVTTIHIARVRPEALAHDALVAWLSNPGGGPDVLQFDSVLGKEASVGDEDLLVDAVAEGHVAEQVAEQIVHLDIVLGFDLSFEAVQLVEILGLVVSPAHEEMVRQADLPCKQDHDHFHSKTSPVDEVSIEKVWIFLGRASVNLKDVNQVIVLAVDISANSNLLIVFSLDIDHRLVFGE